MAFVNFASLIGKGWIWGKNTEKRFFNPANTMRLGTKGAVYLDVDAPYKIFNENPQVNQVIRKKSAMFANGIFRLKDMDGNEMEMPTELSALLENPNLMQSQNEWLRQYLEQKDVYGNQFIYKNQVSTVQKVPTSLNHISPRYLTPILTGKFYDQVDILGIIKAYKLEINTSVKYYEPKDILWTRISDLDEPLVGVSPLKSLRYPITNTKYAYDYLNIISGEKGAIGILANKNRDQMGSIPLTPEEKQKLERAYQNQFGLGTNDMGYDKMRILLTDSDISWQPMTYPTRDLMLMEQIDANFLTIIDHFGLNVNIFSSKNQTYENVKNAIKQCYEDTITPEADQFAQSLTKFLGIDKTYNAKLELDYSYLNILKDDTKLKADTFASVSNSLSQLVGAGIITQEQSLTIMLNSFGFKTE